MQTSLLKSPGTMLSSDSSLSFEKKSMAKAPNLRGIDEPGKPSLKTSKPALWERNEPITCRGYGTWAQILTCACTWWPSQLTGACMGTAIDCHDRTRVMVQFRASIVIPEVVISPTGMEENFVMGMAPWSRSAVGKVTYEDWRGYKVEQSIKLLQHHNLVDSIPQTGPPF